MGRLKLIGAGALVRFMYLSLSAITARFVAGALTKMLFDILASFVDPEGPIIAIIRTALMLILTVFLCGLFSYIEGFHWAEFKEGEVGCECLIAVPVYFGISMLLGFGEWICGSVKTIAGFMYYGGQMNTELTVSTKEVHLWMFIVAWIIVTGLSVLAIFGGYKYGRVQRFAQREQLYEEAEKKKRNTEKRQNNGSDNKN